MLKVMGERSIVDVFLAALYRQAGEGSHVFTIVGVEHQPLRAVYQNYRGEVVLDDNFWGLFTAVQGSLDNGELCVVMLRSLLTVGAGKPPFIVLRAWTLTPVGVIPVTAEDLAAHAGYELDEEPLRGAPVTYANGWDPDLDALGL